MCSEDEVERRITLQINVILVRVPRRNGTNRMGKYIDGDLF